MLIECQRGRGITGSKPLETCEALGIGWPAVDENVTLFRMLKERANCVAAHVATHGDSICLNSNQSHETVNQSAALENAKDANMLLLSPECKQADARI